MASNPVSALIAVRKGSVRVKNKNVRPFAGSNLLAIKVKQLMQVQGIDNVYVNSDCETMLEQAASLGAIPVPRDPAVCGDDVTMSDVYASMAKQIPGDEDNTQIMYANVTNPCCDRTCIQKVVNHYNSMDFRFDSLTTATRIHEFLWKNGKPINYDLNNQPRSQDLPEIYALNFAVSILPKKLMIQRKNIVGFNPFLYQLTEEEAIDIDTPLDFLVAETAYNNRNTQNSD